MLIDRIDRSLGKATERAIRSHHARRLRRVRWEHALDPDDPGLWCAGEPPPREGCSLEVLIDGEEALPAIAQAISAAKSHVHIAGWFRQPRFRAGAWRRRELPAGPPGRGRGARPRAGSALGGVTGSGLLAHPKDGPQGPGHAQRRDADPVRARPTRASDPLPPRKARHRRRRGRLRRRDRPDRARGRPVRSPSPPPPRRPGLARHRPRGFEARSSPMSPGISRSAGMRWRTRISGRRRSRR